MSGRTAPQTLDIRSDEFLSDPAPVLAALRHGSGVCPVDHGGTAHGGTDNTSATWMVVTRHDLAREVLRDTATYSNRISKHVAPPSEVAEEITAIRAQGWPYTAALGASDAPEHTRHRRLVNKAFTPRGVAAMEPVVREAAEHLAAALPDGEEIDFLAAFGEHLPVLAISRVLGLPDRRAGDIRRWSTAAVASIGASPTAEEYLRYERDLLDYQQTMAALLEAGRDGSGAGVIGQLAVLAAEAEADGGEPWDIALLLTLLRELVVAGNETTGKFLAEAIRLIGPGPEPWARLRENPSASDQMVEEALRLASPTQSVMRRVVADTELGGVPLRAGSLLLVSVASANRDEALFAGPDDFDPERDDVRAHLAFGMGAHMCIGAGLARMESRVALEVLAQHVDRIVPAAEEPLYNRSYTIRGPVAMRATVHRLKETP